MTIGDRVKIHIDPGHSQALDIPRGVGVIQLIEHEANHVSLLVHFDEMSVYLTSVAPREVEVLSTVSVEAHGGACAETLGRHRCAGV